MTVFTHQRRFLSFMFVIALSLLSGWPRAVPSGHAETGASVGWSYMIRQFSPGGILPLPDIGFILYGAYFQNDGDNANFPLILAIQENGRVAWSMAFPTLNGRVVDIQPVSDGTYAAFFSMDNELMVLIFDRGGHVLTGNRFGNYDSYDFFAWGQKFFPLEDGGFLLIANEDLNICRCQENLLNLVLVRLNSDLNVEWIRYYQNPYTYGTFLSFRGLPGIGFQVYVDTFDFVYMNDAAEWFTFSLNGEILERGEIPFKSSDLWAGDDALYIIEPFPANRLLKISNDFRLEFYREYDHFQPKRITPVAGRGTGVIGTLSVYGDGFGFLTADGQIYDFAAYRFFKKAELQNVIPTPDGSLLFLFGGYSSPNHYYTYLLKETPGQQYLCSHADLHQRPMGYLRKISSVRGDDRDFEPINPPTPFGFYQKMILTSKRLYKTITFHENFDFFGDVYSHYEIPFEETPIPLKPKLIPICLLETQ